MRLNRTKTVARAARVLKPRYSAWLSAVYPRLFPAVIVLIFGVQEGAPVLLPLSLVSLAMTASGFIPLAWAIWRERADRPPVMRFWVDGSGSALVVRRQLTGEVLLRRWDPHLQGANLRHAKLSGSDLRGVNLRAAKLRRADLRGADLRKAELAEADLSEADLRRAKVNGARLIGARFGGANLCGADLWGTDLVGANRLDAADFSHARYDAATRWPAGFDPIKAGAHYETGGEADLPIPHDGEVGSEAKLPIPAHSVARVEEATTEALRDNGSGFALNVRHVRTGALMLQSETGSLARADLRNAQLAGANLSQMRMTRANLAGADLSGANLSFALLMSANLHGATLRGADLTGARLGRATFQGADLRLACLGTAGLERTSFRNADLRGANFVGRGLSVSLWDRVLGPADFTGARWNSATRWPPGFDPNKAGALYEQGGESDLPIPHDGESGIDSQLPIPADSRQRIEESTQEAVQVGGRG